MNNIIDIKKKKENNFDIDKLKSEYDIIQKDSIDKEVSEIVYYINRELTSYGCVKLSLDPFTVRATNGTYTFNLNKESTDELIEELKSKLDCAIVNGYYYFEFK